MWWQSKHSKTVGQVGTGGSAQARGTGYLCPAPDCLPHRPRIDESVPRPVRTLFQAVRPSHLYCKFSLKQRPWGTQKIVIIYLINYFERSGTNVKTIAVAGILWVASVAYSLGYVEILACIVPKVSRGTAMVFTHYLFLYWRSLRSTSMKTRNVQINSHLNENHLEGFVLGIAFVIIPFARLF